MTTVITRYVSRRRSDQTRFWTVDLDKLQVIYKARFRRTGGTTMGMTEVESDGVDRSTVSLKSKSDDTQNARGARQGMAYLTFRLLDRNKHIRSLRDEDVASLAEKDAVIAAKLEELKELRDARQAFVEQAWQRGQKIDISLLEEKANA